MDGEWNQFVRCQDRFFWTRPTRRSFQYKLFFVIEKYRYSLRILMLQVKQANSFDRKKTNTYIAGKMHNIRSLSSNSIFLLVGFLLTSNLAWCVLEYESLAQTRGINCSIEWHPRPPLIRPSYSALWAVPGNTGCWNGSYSSTYQTMNFWRKFAGVTRILHFEFQPVEFYWSRQSCCVTLQCVHSDTLFFLTIFF